MHGDVYSGHSTTLLIYTFILIIDISLLNWLIYFVLFCYLILPALLPPYPAAFTKTYSPLVRLLDSDIMIHIMSIVLSRTLAPKSRSFTEGQLERVRIKLTWKSDQNLNFLER